MSYSNFYTRFYRFKERAGAALGAIGRFYPTRYYGAAFLALQIVSWLQAVLIKKNLSGEVLVLHYNVDFGIDLVGDPVRIFLYPALGLLVGLLNLALAALIYRHFEFKYLTHLLLGAIVAFNCLMVSALLAIYLINFR